LYFDFGLQRSWDKKTRKGKNQRRKELEDKQNEKWKEGKRRLDVSRHLPVGHEANAEI
jgi:hypothetical protein